LRHFGIGNKLVNFAAVKNHAEDIGTIEYLRHGHSGRLGDGAYRHRGHRLDGRAL
jgi:hypothetical protein